MKKLLISILTLISTITFALSLAACETVYTVTFMADGETYTTAQATEKESFVFPENPTKANHTFNGWFLDDGTWQLPFNEETVTASPITENINVYAHFTLNTIEGVTFTSQEYTYDGNEKEIAVENLPDDASVSYNIANKQTNAGVYEIIATVSKPNYENKVLTATLKINEAVMTGIKFENKRVLAGTIATIEATGYPAGATVTYTNAGPYSTRGTYEIGVTIQKENYVPYEATATLSVVDVKDLIPSKMYAAEARGNKYSVNGGQQYYLCLVEFNDDYATANLYATKFDSIKRSTNKISNATVRASIVNNEVRVTIQWGTGYNSVILKESNGSLAYFNGGYDRNYWDHEVAEGFCDAKPTLHPYTGQFKLDFSSYEVGQTFAPTGWKEEVMNEDGVFEASSGNAIIVEGDNGNALSLKIGADANNIYKYTYIFSDKGLGEFSFHKLSFSNCAALRVKYIYASGSTINILGDRFGFYDRGEISMDSFDWLSGVGYQYNNIVGIQIEAYKGQYYNHNNTIEFNGLEFSFTDEI